MENRDIPEEDSEDGGSDSDPSVDNLDNEEIFEKVYDLPTSKIQLREQEKQQSI